MPDLKTILGGSGLDDTVWTDARAGKLDSVDASVSSRAPASTALSSATWSATRAGNLDSIPTILTDTAALDGRLTDTRAGKLDNLDASISGIPAAVAAQVGGGGMQVKSIQLGEHTGNVSDNPLVVGITSVVKAKSVLIFSFAYAETNILYSVRGAFTSTALYFSGPDNSSPHLCSVSWYVIEYE